MLASSRLQASRSNPTGLTSPPTVGSIVRCRNRQWVVLPSEREEVIILRPLSGSEEQICGIYTVLGEKIESATFSPPEPQTLRDHEAGRLLLDAARLSLRSGAGPFRCLGRLSVRPRPYQIVPLLMALRQETVRLLIADDVGIGKTVETALIARELLDRGDIQRIGVLCPPQLCDQWQRELKQKFNIDAVVIRSGTVAKLERELPSGNSHIFSYYRHIIVSLDYAKSDRRRASFLAHRPDLVIVDEAHTATQSKEGANQQRHQLVSKLAENPDQHLILLTATPHNGIETSFLSLLGFLKPEFSTFQLDALSEKQRAELAKHFIQRRRADVQDWMAENTPFSIRKSIEYPYQLSNEYRELFDRVFDFVRGLVRSVDESLSHAQKRGRYWAALAIIRCVMSSPAAAIATLSRQADKNANLDDLAEKTRDESVEDIDRVASPYVYDVTEEELSVDSTPTALVEQSIRTYPDSARKRLRDFARAAEQLTSKKDQKLQYTLKIVKELLTEGYNPILWCRYIATANYYAQALKAEFVGKRGVQPRVIAITGELSEDEREIRLDELKSCPQRVLVATDCLSEGINLQEHFNACCHIDLPFNPNRLEQREGRIDRYGQTTPQLKCILLYGQDNPVDGVVLDVLLRKAVTIHRNLGITVPIPMDSATVQEAIFQSLFERSTTVRQLSLFDSNPALASLHQDWEKAKEKEIQNRTRFAQRSIKPEEVQQELNESDEILGNEADVERFVRNALDRWEISLVKKKVGWQLSRIPDCLEIENRPRTIAFTTPVAEGVEYVGRNHPLVEGLARYLFEEALESSHSIAESSSPPFASRCGVTVTNAIAKPTFILLLRSRLLLTGRNTRPLLAEECLARGFTGTPDRPCWLSGTETLALFDTVVPTTDISQEEKREWIEMVIDRLEDLTPSLTEIATERAETLLASHRRVRRFTGEGMLQKVEPQLPMDILGVYILLPP
ncbi:helicase-related protein [Microcystis aeruginosa]|uniref:helicase-related protein n=1 Tax=Microcystis aeruginosa TaxID=1126 RepID=UPI0006277A4A|nr:helicase-related protein [Microcystis aeruginosa]